ncbi:hypothetical protein ABB02_01196 [Clostridiaceae bacterium JG1575]|nr:hypothetical protein ABB02_01196 [Clostridiaceae bacterium JG1575]
MNLDPTKTFESLYEVTPAHSAKALGSGSLEVLGTPALVAFMENTCQGAIASWIPEGSTSVGVEFEIEHLKASALGATIRCSCTVTEQEGQVIHFSVMAHDGEHLVALGRHVRAIVEVERFMKRLNR